MKKKVTQLKLNPNNPRFIRDDKFEKLKISLTDFPEMMDARPIVIDEDGIILGGNMRFRACKELGWKEVEVNVLKGLTEKQKREFIIKDNASFGEWDWEILANEWDDEELKQYGIDVKFTADELLDEDDDEKKTKHKCPMCGHRW
jgi:ParB-like chromosome segregation protein Spo0J